MTAFTDRDFPPDALRMLDSRQHILLTGNAGTGKSTLLNHWRSTRHQRRILLAAPTGIAALNIGGTTIHRLIHLTPGLTPEQAARRVRDWKPQWLSPLQVADTLIIDEISMMRADLMDTLDLTCQHARHDTRPFGGIRLIMTGDLNQLPPVVTRDDQAMFGPHHRWAGPWMFQSHVIQQLTRSRRLAHIHLTRTHRQTDPAFIRLLDAIRAGHPTQNQLDLLNRQASRRPDPNGISLTALNHDAQRINQWHARQLSGPEQTWRAHITGDWPDRLAPAPASLTLKPGMRIIMLANHADNLYANGSQGTITRLTHDGPIILFDTGEETLITPRQWPIGRDQTQPDPTSESEYTIRHHIIGAYRQLPLKPGWAITIHKSQGMTFTHTNINPGARPLFAPGMGYVALSRNQTLTGIRLSRPLTGRDLTCDHTPDRFLTQLESNA